MRVWGWDDVHGWGAAAVAAAQARGHEAKVFTHLFEPDDGVVLMHMHQHPAVRMHHKRMMQQWATNPLLKPMPSYRVSVLFDDKIEQLRQLAKWLPPTKLFRSPASARDYMDRMPALPIMSKATQGGGTRLHRSLDDLRREVKLAFSDLGVKNRHGERQHGYVYWQEYLGDPEFIYRVAAVGTDRIAIKRGRRGNQNGERPSAPVHTFDEQALAVLDYADAFFRAEGIRYGAIDIIVADGRCYYLKIVAGFQLRRFAESRFMHDGRNGSEWWDVWIRQVEAGNW